MRTSPLPASVVALAAVGLVACGAPAAPAPAQGPIVLRSAAATGPSSPMSTATGSTTGPTTPAAPSPPTEPTTPTRPTRSVGNGAAPLARDVIDHDADVDVRDQEGDGRSVLVAEVTLTVGSGHVVVVDPSSRAVLGSASVRAGTTEALTVRLATPVPRSGEYLVLLHADDGDGRYDDARDGLVVDLDDDGGGDDSRAGGGRAVDEDFRYTLR